MDLVLWPQKETSRAPRHRGEIHCRRRNTRDRVGVIMMRLPIDRYQRESRKSHATSIVRVVQEHCRICWRHREYGRGCAESSLVGFGNRDWRGHWAATAVVVIIETVLRRMINRRRPDLVRV